MFSGQGSQYYRMGLELYEGDAAFRRHATALDSFVREMAGYSVCQLLYEQGRRITEPFTDASQSGAAIYVMERALVLTLRDYGLEPAIVLGASLGTLAACASAGCVDDAATLRATLALGKLMEEACEAGVMIAVLDHPDIYRCSSVLRSLSDLAAVNFDASFVISVAEANRVAVEDFLKRANVLYQVMNVSRAYHSRWIDRARQPFLDRFEELPFRSPAVPVVCCAAAAPLKSVGAEALWDAVRQPIRFHDTVKHLENNGPHRYVDVGPSGTLATFLKYSLRPNSHSEILPILTPFGQSLERLRQVTRLRRH